MSYEQSAGIEINFDDEGEGVYVRSQSSETLRRSCGRIQDAPENKAGIRAEIAALIEKFVASGGQVEQVSAAQPSVFEVVDVYERTRNTTHDIKTAGHTAIIKKPGSDDLQAVSFSAINKGIVLEIGQTYEMQFGSLPSAKNTQWNGQRYTMSAYIDVAKVCKQPARTQQYETCEVA